MKEYDQTECLKVELFNECSLFCCQNKLRAVNTCHQLIQHYISGP